MTSGNIFDILVILCGLYMIYNSVIMKTQGEIKSGVVISKGVDPSSIRDKEGFINYVWKKLLIMGIFCFTAGVVNVLLTVYGGESKSVSMIMLAMNTLFLVCLVIFTVLVMKAQKRFIK